MNQFWIELKSLFRKWSDCEGGSIAFNTSATHTRLTSVINYLARLQVV